MNALLAPDKFKGTLTAAEVAEAMAAGFGPGDDVDLCPVADGGEGTLDVLLAAKDGEVLEAEVSDPLGRRVTARLGMLRGGTAVVETAEAIGLWRLAEDERDPLRTSSRGAGELIAAAIGAGASRVLVGCGGSATSDGGEGALQAFDPSGARIVVLSDTLLPYESAVRFAAQKGAGEGEVRAIAERLRDGARRLPKDPTGVEMTGAAGGLSGALWAHGAELALGSRHVLEAIGFPARMRAADVVLTGEGCLDLTSLGGKAAGEVATACRQAGVPCHAIVGRRKLDAFGTRVLALDSVAEAGTPAEIAGAAAAISERFSSRAP